MYKRQALRTVRTLLEKHPDAGECIKGVGFSGQMHGLVVIGRDGKPLRNAIIWADQRSQEEIQNLYSIIPKEEYHQISLNSVSTGFLISSLMWVKAHEPEVYNSIDKVMLPKDYLRYRMCKELGTDMSDASSCLLYTSQSH